jgi:periplasmic divalent cation tolerance protein
MLDADGEVIVLTTVADSTQASALARGILDKRLAACVTCIGNGLSFFRWQSDKISEEPETVLLIKTHREKLADLEHHFENEHPYDVPEFVVLPMSGLSAAYSNYMNQEMRLKHQGDA